jgi:hypothetical protein
MERKKEGTLEPVERLVEFEERPKDRRKEETEDTRHPSLGTDQGLNPWGRLENVGVDIFPSKKKKKKKNKRRQVMSLSCPPLSN